ncbi:MotA/TolQ/ExbB proton channel family protein [bacterium]|nr:MotA/TolQ/ExbB proton channel family protein [bacterium]
MESYLDRYIYAGGVMMVFLIPTSLLALGWIFRGFIQLRRARVMPRKLTQATAAIHTTEEALRFEEAMETHPSSLGRLAAHLLKLNVVGADRKSDEEENEVLRPALNDEIDRLLQETAGLTTVYAVAPLMGLLGTVIGMIGTFQEFTTNPEHSIADLSFGINEALVTTMWGLVIAIPAFIFVQIFRRCIFRYEKELLPRAAKDLARQVWEKKRNEE